MSEPALTRMSVDAFLGWGLYQERRYELVDGAPVAMAGAKQRHDLIDMNAQGALRAILRGRPRRNFSADIAIRIPAGNVRRPDAGIDCGALNEDATTASAPFLVLEVLSPSARDFDMFGKLEEYKTVPSLAHIVIVDPDTPQAYHWSRTPGEPWRHVLLEGLDAIVALPAFDGAIGLTDLYEGLTFRPLPRLVRDGDQPA